jgi:hypothetical protein
MKKFTIKAGHMPLKIIRTKKGEFLLITLKGAEEKTVTKLITTNLTIFWYTVYFSKES